MTLTDLINSIFEAGASLFLLNNCRDMLRKRAVAGVTIMSAVFFWLLSAWRLFFYSNLDQTFSAICGVAMFAANCLTIFLVIKFSKRKCWNWETTPA